MTDALLKKEAAEKITVESGERLILANSVTNTQVVLTEGARLTYVLFANNGWSGIPKITFEFVGRNSELNFLGFIIGLGKQTFPFETISRHISPQTKAHYHLRAVMFDDSTVDYKGNLIIEKSAQLTDTYLAHHTLLLSDGARARTIPALEIEADDVKAGHAATIGKVDKDLMFYVKSRGISEKEAEQLLVSGFFERQLRMIPEEKAQASLRKNLLHALPSSAHIDNEM